MKKLCNEVTDTQFWLKFGRKFELIGIPKGHFGPVFRCKVLNKVSELSFMTMKKFLFPKSMFYIKCKPIMNTLKSFCQHWDLNPDCLVSSPVC